MWMSARREPGSNKFTVVFSCYSSWTVFFHARASFFVTLFCFRVA